MKNIIVDGSKFTWKKNHGNTFISDLGLRGFPNTLYVKSDRTNQVIMFVPSDSIYSDNELVSVVYVAPGMGFSLEIFND
jgi:hypothetical protein